jgi:hypothetical protein
MKLLNMHYSPASCYFYDLDPNNFLSTLFSKYMVIPSILDPRKCEYLKDYLLDFE